jgi:hypothetical protein
VEERVDAEGREPLEEHGLGHLLADQRRHLAQQLHDGDPKSTSAKV